MNEIHTQVFKSPVGELVIGDFQNTLCLCDWKYRKQRSQIDDRITKGLNAVFIEQETELTHSTIQQLNDYFEHRNPTFSVPLTLVGSPFQKEIWNELIKIPFGKTMTYLDLAKRYGNTKAIRAVAAANGANAISIIIPCHRIIGSSGELIGYAGGMNAKKKLIELETPADQQQLNLFD